MGTTADKLNKLKATKEAIRTAINNKGGTLTTSDKFSDYATAIDNIQSGSGDTSNTKYYKYEPKGGTAIPNDGTQISRIYFNINVGSVAETLRDLNLTYYELNGFKFYPFIFDTNTNNAYLINKEGDIEIINFADQTQYEFITKDGWKNEIISKNGIIEFSSPITTVSAFNGVPIGLENEKIKSIISFDNSFSTQKKECSYEDIVKGKIDEVESNSDYIHKGAFARCGGIKNINFPNAKVIGNRAFSYCHSLINVQLPLLEIVEQGLFCQCFSLKSVCLKCATKLENASFNLSSELTTLILQANQVVVMEDSTVISNTPIKDNTTEGFIYVPDNLVESYKVANVWSEYASKIKPLSELPQEYKDLYNIA